MLMIFGIKVGFGDDDNLGVRIVYSKLDLVEAGVHGSIPSVDLNDGKVIGIFDVTIGDML